LLTTWFIIFTRSGQGCKLNDVLGVSFMMDIARHPLKDPSLWIPVVPTNVEGSTVLKQMFFILVFLGSHKVEQTRITEAVKSSFLSGFISLSLRPFFSLSK